jgi:SRSO17 transposase
MTARELERLEAALDAYLGEMLEGLGRRERREAMGHYVQGLLLDGERKSVLPMAERLCERVPERVEAVRQQLSECVTYADWSHETLLWRMGHVLEARLGARLQAWALDDSGLRKTGTHSVGVARQWLGSVGKVENCQVLVSLHAVGEQASCPLALRLYLPREWAEDAARRAAAGVPESVRFEEKWRLALQQVEAALEAGLAPRPVLADGAFGDVMAVRERLQALALPYALHLKGAHVFWAEGLAACASEPLSADALAHALPRSAWRRVTWREGTRGRQASRFARLRVVAAPDWTHGAAPPLAPEELLIEWPEDEDAPTRFIVAHGLEALSLTRLVRLAKLRWRIEQDYAQLKGEVGLDHFEGRKWRGLHHHAALCTLAYGFLALQRALFPPVRRRPPQPRSGAQGAAGGAAA